MLVDLPDKLVAEAGEHGIPVQLSDRELERLGLLPNLPDHRLHRLVRPAPQLSRQLVTERLTDRASSERHSPLGDLAQQRGPVQAGHQGRHVHGCGLRRCQFLSGAQ